MTFLSTMRSSITLLLVLLSFTVWAQDDIPTLSGKRLVYDEAAMLTDAAEDALNARLIAFDDTTSTQIAVVTMPTISGYDVADYAVRLAQKNGIGRAGKDNGLLVLIAQQERKITIQVGYGLEGVITDGLAGDIIRNYMEPAFKKSDYMGGIVAATDVLMKLSSGEFTADDVKSDRDFPPLIGLLPMLFIFMVFYLISRRRQQYGQDFSGRGYHRTGPIWWGGGFGGSSSGGFGSGGFGGFGGGGFGGGGASGGW